MLKLYNSYSKKLEGFKPIKSKQVKLYTCGPTVYDNPHIGNWRTFLTEDILKRYLTYKGLKVLHTRNLTDVDDKTIKRSMEQKISLSTLTKKYIDSFFSDQQKLNVVPADHYPRATEYIPDMVQYVKQLMKKGYAYKGEDGSIYFSISKFKKYGKLSNVQLKELKAGARVNQDEYSKENPQDFALWKAWVKEDGEVFWQTDLGKGRPGWHLECSVMAMKLLGKQIDIHSGGEDLVFPHHENEIAQSEAITGKHFVNYWLHTRFLLVNGQKMAKRDNNFFTLEDLKQFNPLAIRLELISAHYRQQLNFTLQGIEEKQKALIGLQEFIERLQELHGDKNNLSVKKLISNTQKEFEKAMDNDLNIPEALRALFELVSDTNKLIATKDLSQKNAQEILELLARINSVFGILNFERRNEEIPKEVVQLAEERESARQAKDWKKADELRTKIQEKGYQIIDSSDGQKIKKAN